MPTFSASDELVSFAAALNGQYEIEREIGRGGMGVVYLARDLRLDRMVAIKTLPAALQNDASVRERFLREARTAARLNHPNIVPIHRADEAGGQVFFVMGFIDGDSLAARIASGPMSPRDALPILRDVVQALGYAHKHGVIHRDVKTENILLDTATGRSMVTDFGIARVAAAAPLTATGQVLGTVYYLSPEQVADENVDARSDIYALGVVGFAMLSGRFPFDGSLASAVLISHVVKPAPKLGEVAPTVPAALAAIIDRCLAKNPADRFQSCAELDAAFEAVRAEASAVGVAAPIRGTPLISSTEAQSILGRAASLDGAAPSAPAPAKQRDAKADQERQEGFKTAILREAAAEAGISPANMERALAEHGLRQAPAQAPFRDFRVDRRAARVLHDLTKRGIVDTPATHFEMVLEGEVPTDDHDLLVDIVQDYFGAGGTAGTIGRALSFKGTTENGRALEVSVQPRGGRTTLQVKESFKRIVHTIWGASVATVGILGGALLSAGMENGLPFIGMLGLSALVSAILTKAYAERREKESRRLLNELTNQAETSIRAAEPKRLR
jgi:eukaryotic-like serine/threonine-protein kinase